MAFVRELTIPTEKQPLVDLRTEGCRVVSVGDPYGRNLCFLDWAHYFFFQVAPQL
jgi:hypothetical protein